MMKSQHPESAATDAQAEAEENPPLLFAWEPARNRRRIPRRLMVLLGISAFGHIGSFYGLQVLYTTPATLPPVPAQITLLPPHSPASRALEQWLLVADPALAISAPHAASGRQTLAELPALRYVPSFAADRAGNDARHGGGTDSLLDELDAAAASRRSSASDPTQGSAAGSRNSLRPPSVRRESAAPEARRVAPNVSVLRLSASLQRRLGAQADSLPLELPSPARPNEPVATAASTTLSPAVLLLYVPPEGGSLMVFLQNSSGRASLDEAARIFLEARFSATPPGEATWGEATVFWGRDAYR